MNSRTITVIKNLIAGMSRGNGKDGKIQKESIDLKFFAGYAFSTYFPEHWRIFATTYRRYFRHSPCILSDHVVHLKMSKLKVKSPLEFYENILFWHWRKNRNRWKQTILEKNVPLIKFYKKYIGFAM